MRHNDFPILKAAVAPLELLTRERLIQRWQCGSDSFFYRAELQGLLLPRRCGGLLRYAWEDVLAFEGGPARPGLKAEYRKDLLTATQIGAYCGCSEAKVLNEAKAGRLMVRRIGRVARFVPAEVRLWQQTHWQAGKRRRWGWT